MTNNFHTDVAAGPVLRSGVNTALGELDDGITKFRDGVNSFVQLNIGATTTLTLSSDAITVTRNRHLVDTQSAAAADDLSTINGSTDGDLLVLQSVSAARVVTIKHNVGNIWMPSATDIVLDDPKKTAQFVYDSTSSKWLHIQVSQLLQLRTAVPSTTYTPTILGIPDKTYVTTGGNSPRLALMPGLDVRNRKELHANGTTFAGVGCTLTGAGTVTASNQTDGQFSRLDSTTTINTLTFTEPATAMFRRQYNPVFHAIVRTDSSLADMRIWIGLLSGINNNDTLSAVSAFAFRYSSVAGDAGWRPVTNDGTTQNTGSAIGTIATSTKYKLSIRVDSAGGVAYFSVNDGAEVSLSANLPATTTDLFMGVFFYNLAAASKYLHVSRAIVEYD